MFDNYNSKKGDNKFYTLYEIVAGDTLYKISKEFNVNTKLLAELNGLKLEDYIYPGQIIMIPKKNVSYYITKEGDTLKIVSDIFGTNEENLVSQNSTIYLMPEQMIYYIK